MRTKKRTLVALIVIAVTAFILVVTPFFIDANRFRPEIQLALAEKLGRKVEIGHLRVSLISGSLVADQIAIADDPAYSREPFVSAKSLAVGVDLIPLIFSRDLKVHSLTFDDLRIQLLRTAAGEWNFASLRATEKTRHDRPGDPPGEVSANPRTSSTSRAGLTNFSVDRLKISNGTIAFGRAGGRTRLAYQDVYITAENISQTAAFPFRFQARTPGGGKLNLEAHVGPVGSGDTNRMPFEGQLKADSVPAADVENLLAVLGYSLPEGSSLKGGTIKADLGFRGPLDRIVTSGPVQLSNVTLAGFSLASKLAGALGSAEATTGNDTLIQLASSKLRYAPEGLRADDLNIVIPVIGGVTGAGTVGANNSLNFHMVAKLAGTSPLAALSKLPLFSQDGALPFRIQGTTSNPVIVPDIGGLANTPLNRLGDSQPGGLGGIVGGMLKKKSRP